MATPPKPTLEQKRLLEQRTFILHSDRVEVRVADRTAEDTFFVPYEHINNGKRFTRKKGQPNYGVYVISRNVAIVLFFCRIFGAMDTWSWFFAFFASAFIFFGIHVYTVKRFIELKVTGPEPLILFQDEPSEEAVLAFLDTLYTHRDQYLRTHYYLPCDAHTEQGRALLKRLHDMNVITQPEYTQKMDLGQHGDLRSN